MRHSRTVPGLFAAIAVVALLPAGAAAESYVPPSNSAATQYTEAIPTAGGHSDTKKGNKKQGRSPKQVLGKHGAKQLEAQGQSGREAAEFAAATAPSQATSETSSTPQPEAGQGGSANAGGAGQGEGTGGKSGHEAPPPQHSGGGQGNGQVAASEDSGGSSGLGEVLGQAVGSSSGGIGWLLPVAILGAIAWAVAFLMRQRNRPTP